MREEDDNLTEMANNVHGDMLSENPAVAASAFGSHRVIPDRWKGMSVEQVQEVLDTREKQRQEKEVISVVQWAHLASVWEVWAYLRCKKAGGLARIVATQMRRDGLSTQPAGAFLGFESRVIDR